MHAEWNRMSPRISATSVERLRAIATRLALGWRGCTSSGQLSCDTERWVLQSGQEEWATYPELMLVALAFGAKTMTSLEAVLVLHDVPLPISWTVS
jgi:hypothetical protein